MGLCRLRSKLHSVSCAGHSDSRSPSCPVAFEAGQPYIVTGVAFGIVQTVNAELLGVLWLVGPEDLDVASGTLVILGLLEM